ncbi:winged helix-turn-helix transcriptional regulator [Nocardia sp. NPDC057455]|uniref:winged helix-turn-helix transcriptional regulator n=1 Tax=Nocardia sp. NPDC057455 TaxID=3346138 RepID=UPI0036710C8C
MVCQDEAGLLSRADTRPGQKAEYRLTEPAIQLVPIIVQLGAWGLRHRPTTRRLRVRAELLEAGCPRLWAEFMDELRASHLGIPRPDPDRRSATQQLAQAYADAVTESADAEEPATSGT